MDSISDKVKKIRVEYEDKPLNIEDLDTNPLEQFNVWFQIAIDAEVNEANAMAIRIARAFCGKDKVAICGYHGWHDWYLAANLKNKKNLNNHLLKDLHH